MDFNHEDRLVLKKAHPCGSNIFIVVKKGSDIKLKCENCSRVIWIKRSLLEKKIIEIKNKK